MVKKHRKIVTDRDDNEYSIEEDLGSGGQAMVKKVINTKTGKMYALKIYSAKNASLQLKKNIKTLIAEGGIKDSSGNQLDFVVTPISIVDGKNGSFGYIMDLVNLDDYTSIIPSWTKPEKRPSLKTICKIVKNLCVFYRALHRSKGWCYKDLNEGNVYFNPKSGDVIIIDTDNIGTFSKSTVKGTVRYMAPEVVTGEYNPDTRSDYFSLAVFIYRLLIGGYPFEGRFVTDYCIKNDITLDDAMKKLLGTKALYVWHSTDKSNCIENCNVAKWNMQARYYHALSPEIQNAFKNTFETNLSSTRRAERFSDDDWYCLFDELEKKITECTHKTGPCNGFTFPDAQICYACGRKQSVVNNAVSENDHVLTINIICAGGYKKNMDIYSKEIINGSDISDYLPPGNLFSTGYSQKDDLFIIRNISALTWTIYYNDKTQKLCPPGRQVYVKEDRIISLLAKKVNIRFVSQT